MRVLAAVAASALGWGFAAVGVRAAFQADVSTFTVIDGRLGTGTLAVVLYVGLLGRRTSGALWRHGAAMGNPRIGLAPVIASLQHISAGVEGLFITLIPVVTSALAWLLLGERLRDGQLGGLALGLLGATIMIVSGESGLGSTLLPFIGTLYAARYTTAAKVAVVGGILAVIGAALVGRGRTRVKAVVEAAGA